MAAPKIVLHQFIRSHFNEKARWGLAWKGVPHDRIDYLPGPHAPAMQKLSGQTQTPVMVIDGKVVPGSARILDELETRFPQPALYPTDPQLRQRALEIEERFDAEVGPATRTVVFSVLIHDLDYLCAVFSSSKPWLKRKAYRAIVPLVRPLIGKANGVNDPANIARSFEATQRALDFVAENSRATGYLAGQQFSVADLTCAALLAVVVDVEHPDMHRPHPMPPAMQEIVDRWSSHPGAHWVGQQYRLHRASP